MENATEPTAAEVVQMLLDACKELMAESGKQRAGDWEIINTGMVEGQKFLRRSEKKV